MDKVDMTGKCGFKYEEFWYNANKSKTMTQEDWKKWYNEHCGKCKYMSEICMYGEE